MTVYSREIPFSEQTGSANVKINGDMPSQGTDKVEIGFVIAQQ